MSAGDVHVLPIDDLIEHELADDCVCGPELEPLVAGGGWLVSHHSLDGREAHEEATA